MAETIAYRVDGGRTLIGFNPDDGRFVAKKFFIASGLSDSYGVNGYNSALCISLIITLAWMNDCKCNNSLHRCSMIPIYCRMLLSVTPA